MGLGYIFALFIGLIIILSVLRQNWCTKSGHQSAHLWRYQARIVFYSLLFLPGTVLHELSHWIVAEILQVRTGEITILPDFEGKGESQRLGSVATARSDPFRGFLIGVAPFITGLGSLIVLGRMLELGWGIYPAWQIALLIYGIMVISNSMMISKEDQRTWPFIILIIIRIIIVLYRMQPDLSPSISLLASSTLSKLNIVLGVTAGFNLVMIGGSYSLRRLIEKLTKRRIV